MQFRGQSRDARRGIAAVEFAVLLPLLVTFFVGIWEVGRLVEIQQVLSNAAREGARQAATGQYNAAAVQTIVTQYLAAAGVPTGNVVVTVNDLTNPGTDPTQAQYLDTLQVNVSIPFNDVRWCLLSVVTSSATTITSKVQWTTMVDKAYPNLPTPPVG
jgi:Flp pilus assembly protein TadG